ncbi:MAG: hypothetical protein ABL952_07420 [Pyrinomonadaceae bacterium]
MICPKCNVSNYEKNKFCADCGAPLPDFSDGATVMMPHARPTQPAQQNVQPPPPPNQVPPPQSERPTPPQVAMQQPVPQQQQYFPQELPKKKSKFLRMVFGLILVLALLFGGALLATHFLIIKQANRNYVIGDKHKGEEKKTLQFDAQADKLFITNLDENKAQLWQITPDSGVEDSYRIVNRELGDVESLEVVDDKRDASVTISESAIDEGQLWAITNVEGDHYRITNNWLGDTKALSHTKSTHRFLRMRDSGNKEGQLWKKIPAKNGGFYIVNKRYGDNFAMEAIYDGTFTDKMQMRKTGDFGNLMWLMKPDGRGFYTLTTILHDYDKKNRSLDVDPAKKDRVKMAPTGNYSGQKWKITPVGSDYFRLTTEFLGDGKSLEAVTYYQYFVEMVKTSDQDSGQLWTLIRTN